MADTMTPPLLTTQIRRHEHRLENLDELTAQASGVQNGSRVQLVGRVGRPLILYPVHLSRLPANLLEEVRAKDLKNQYQKPIAGLSRHHIRIE